MNLLLRCQIRQWNRGTKLMSKTIKILLIQLFLHVGGVLEKNAVMTCGADLEFLQKTITNINTTTSKNKVKNPLWTNPLRGFDFQESKRPQELRSQESRDLLARTNEPSTGEPSALKPVEGQRPMAAKPEEGGHAAVAERRLQNRTRKNQVIFSPSFWNGTLVL